MIAASVDGDAERFCARWKSERRLCQLAQCSARDGKRADGSDGRVDDVKVVSRGVQPCIEWPDARATLECCRAGIGQRAVRLDGVARDAGASGVDGEEVVPIMGDLDPARGRLAIGVRRASN